MRLDSIRTTAALALVSFLAIPAPRALEGQIFSPPPRSGAPGLWISGGYAYGQPGAYADGRSRTTWSFADGFVPSLALELPLGRGGTTFGVSASQGDFPLRYDAEGLTGTCSAGCDAKARIRTLAGMIRAGGGAGLHQVLEISGGVTEYSNFRTAGGAGLEQETRKNGTLTLGYGFGFPISQRLHAALVQDFGLVFRSREGLAADAPRTVQNHATRLSIRFGFGNR